MAKTAIAVENGTKDNAPNPVVHNTTKGIEQARAFLTDVRNEMRKVVTPSRKEVQATTIVVLATVFIFAFYFWAVDSIFTFGLAKLMAKLVGQQ
jgi:preprotein translocase subunit SecE